MTLDQGSRVMAEYIWIGGSGEDLRSKTKTLDAPVSSPSELPDWNFDGSSTGQAPGHDSEVILKPKAIFPDPFRGGDNILVLCDCYTPAGEPIPSNTRAAAEKIFSDPKVKAEKPWWGLEQEYTLFQPDGRTVIGWPVGGYPGAQGPYYCGVGADRIFGRPVVEAHYKACLYSGIKISGINAEVMAGQWEFQVGPCEGISGADHLWIARYLLLRICEEFGLICSFDPKPIPGEWNGAGCHTNFSTESMRKDGGYQVILDAIKKLGDKHQEHIECYGKGNERRLTGRCETASIDKFSYGVANRGASIRIPREAEKHGKGYFEDRRPASNMDPYIVTSKIVHTVLIA
jgi:glutamine synthetase